MRSALQSALLIGVALLTLGPVDAAQFLVVARSAEGVWSLQPAEEVSINGKDKVRRTITTEGNPAAWDAKALGRVAAAELEALSIVRRAPDGALYGRGGAVPGWHLLLPDGVKPTAPESAAGLWRAAAITLRKDRKDKTLTPVPTAEVYAILTGPDPAALAATLATETDPHQAPGLDQTTAFAQMVSILPAAVKTFPTGPATDRIRAFVRSAMAERMRAWNAGDAPVTVLDQCLALAAASEAAFAEDTPQAELRKSARAPRAWLDRRLAILRALDAGGQSDPFLLAYREFEMYDQSFPALVTARQAHLKASAAAHLASGQRLHRAGDYANAIRHLRIAQWRDPQLAEAGNLLEQVRLEVARLSSQKFAEGRRDLDPRSPRQVQLQRRLLMAEQYLNDGKQAEAEQAIREAESVDKEEPKIKLLEARLAVLRGDLGRAVALLDHYAGLAVTPQDFDAGEKLRAGVQYKLQNARTETLGQLKGLSSEQRFATALESAANGLKLDNEDTQFLYQAGLNACVLRHCGTAVPLLRRFLDITDATTGDRAQRMAATRLLRLAERTAELAAKTGTSAAGVSWFSGAPLKPGVFYDPVSLAFQHKPARVKGSQHLNVTYVWQGNLLQSVHTRYEDKKTATNILKLAVAGAAASQGIGSTVGWRTPDRETNDFYFNYYDDMPQILKVSRDNVVVKSRKIPIGIPGIGGFGGLGALGGLGGGLGGFGGVAGFGGVGGAGALRALATSGLGPMGGTGGLGGASAIAANVRTAAGMARQFTPQDYSVHADPQGGSSSGYLTLWNSPRVDTDVAFAATQKRVAVGFSGNSFFHPFVWDAIHLFELDYDSEGRVRHAWELDVPNAPRLDFTWDGRRLTRLHAADAGGQTVYSRTLHYTGDRLTHEVVTHNGKTSRIDYKYDKEGRLVQAECDEDPSLDGRSRQVEFVAEMPKGGRK